MKKLGLLFVCFFMLSVLFSEDLKVVTFNTWYGLDGNGLLKMGEYETKTRRAKRLEILIDDLKQMNADIIFLQEVNPVGRVTGKIKKALGYSAVSQIYNGGIKIFGMGIPVNLNMGLVILAKKELKLKRVGAKQISGPIGLYNPVLTFHLSEARFVLAGKVTVGNKDLLLFNTHTHAAIPKEDKMFETVEKWQAEGKITSKDKDKYDKAIKADWGRREKEIKAIGEYVMKKANGAPFILAGDFNTTLEASEMSLMVKKLKLADTYHTVHPDLSGFTWDSVHNPNTRNDASLTFVNGEAKTGVELLSAMYDQSPRRIDFILLGGGLGKQNVLDSRVEFNRMTDGIFPSDHFGVLSKITF